MDETAEPPRKTPLHGAHLDAGAKMVPFTGWEMPLQYDGIREEHVAVRTHVGMFDVSHMGRIEVEGPAAVDVLMVALSNDASSLPVGGAQYTLLLDDAAPAEVGDEIRGAAIEDAVLALTRAKPD